MKFNALSDQEINEANLLPAGIYDFEISSAKDEVSKNSGKEMIKLTHKIFDKVTKEHLVIGYLMESMIFKLKNFCNITGLTEKYESGHLLAEDCIGKHGQCEIIVRKGELRPDGLGFYPTKNEVKNYIISAKSDGVTPSQIPLNKLDSFNEDITF